MSLYRRRWRFFRLAILACLTCLVTGWLIFNSSRLQAAASKPVDALFILGGSITREIHAAQLATQTPLPRILISKGSQEPCIWLIFQRLNAPMEGVWSERCADSTFGNFYFGLPILRQWGVQRVKVVTSPTHLPRAKLMAQIIFGAHGIWVDMEIVKEESIPGNRESKLKTGLDVTRSIFWAVLSQVFQPQCSEVTPLLDVDLEAWQKKGFKCQRKAGWRLKAMNTLA